MGTWALEFDPARTGEIYKMVEFNGDIFAFCYGGDGAGVWRYTPPIWVHTFVGDGRGVVWDGQMWMGKVNTMWRSADGIVWNLDYSWGPGVFSHWSALNGEGDYLYAAQASMLGVPGTSFWRRDKAGNWTALPPNYATEFSHSYDIMNYGGYVYWSARASDVRRYSTAWAIEPTLNNEASIYFVVHDGYLYAAGSELEVWRRSAVGAWSKILNIGAPWGAGALSIGSGDIFWITGEDGVNSRVYFYDGAWILHSTAIARFRSAICVDSILVAGTNSCEFWLYTPSFDVTPVGGGLYPEALDVDGDGGLLYVALYNAAGQPLLVRCPLPLTATTLGTAVFNPGAGSAINVKCTNVGGRLSISGRLSAGGNDSVQVSDDAGATWADIAPNWADTAQPLWVSPDTESEDMVALAGVPALGETLNRGQDWITENAALGLVPDSIAKLPLGDEVILGGPGPTVLYSPNRGVTVANITGAIGGAGSVVALEIV